MSSESNMWKVIKPYLIGMGWFPIRMENHIVPGLADVFYFNNKDYRFLELKTCERNKKLRIQESQISMNKKLFGKCWCLIYFGYRQWAVTSMLYLEILDHKKGKDNRFISRSLLLDNIKTHEYVKDALKELP